jgi:hypothetical protein
VEEVCTEVRLKEKIEEWGYVASEVATDIAKAKALASQLEEIILPF